MRTLLTTTNESEVINDIVECNEVRIGVTTVTRIFITSIITEIFFTFSFSHLQLVQRFSSGQIP